MAKPPSSISQSKSDNSDPARSVSRDVFIARQPILDRMQHVMGYELLFRATEHAEAFSGSPEQASARVIADALGTFGLEVMTHGRLAFINITRRLLLDEITALMPPKGVVLELLENIEADAEVVACCRHLKQEGYALALDDFIPSPANRDLIPLADFIKVDLGLVSDLPAWVRAVTQTAMGPSPPSARAAAPSTWSGSATSAGIARARRPSDRISRAASSSRSWPRARRARSAPSRANSRAMARPRPADAPVTRTMRARRAARLPRRS
jgi:hypothetical protein